MADQPTKTKTQGGKKRLLLGGAAAVIIAASSAIATAFLVPLQAASADHSEPDRPQLVRRDGEEVHGNSADGRSPDPATYVETYIPLEEPFTSGLKGGANFIQTSFALSTFYDQRVGEAVSKHNMAIRSAILLALSERDPIGLNSSAGKEQLLADLRVIVNQTLEEREGFGGIHKVHFTSLVIQ